MERNQKYLDKLDQIMKETIINTANYKGENNLVNTEYSERASQIAKIIEKSDFGCQKKNVASLVSLIIQEPIPFKIEKEDDEKLIHTVAIDNDGMPGYINGLDDDNDLKVILPGGQEGFMSSYTMATEEQVRELFACFRGPVKYMGAEAIEECRCSNDLRDQLESA